MPEEEAVHRVLKPLLGTLEYMHSRFVVQRNITLANLRFEANSRNIKLCDFGLSVSLAKKPSVFRVGPLNHVVPARYVLEPFTRVDEDITSGVDISKEYGPRIDAWTVGILLFELVTGGAPGVALSAKANDFVRTCMGANPQAAPTPRSLLAHALFEDVTHANMTLGRADRRTHAVQEELQMPTAQEFPIMILGDQVGALGTSLRTRMDPSMPNGAKIAALMAHCHAAALQPRLAPGQQQGCLRSYPDSAAAGCVAPPISGGGLGGGRIAERGGSGLMSALNRMHSAGGACEDMPQAASYAVGASQLSGSAAATMDAGPAAQPSPSGQPHPIWAFFPHGDPFHADCVHDPEQRAAGVAKVADPASPLSRHDKEIKWDADAVRTSPPCKERAIGRREADAQGNRNGAGFAPCTDDRQQPTYIGEPAGPSLAFSRHDKEIRWDADAMRTSPPCKEHPIGRPQADAQGNRNGAGFTPCADDRQQPAYIGEPAGPSLAFSRHDKEIKWDADAVRTSPPCKERAICRPQADT